MATAAQLGMKLRMIPSSQTKITKKNLEFHNP